MKTTLVALILLNALTAILLVKKPVVHKRHAKKHVALHRKPCHGKRVQHRRARVVRRRVVHKKHFRRHARKNNRFNMKRRAFVVGNTRKLGGERAADSWASKTQEGVNSQAATDAIAYGAGKAQSFAGPSGAQSQAEGTLGTNTASSYNADNYRNEDSWGQSSRGGAASSFSNKSNSKQQIAGAAYGASKGFGGSGAGSGVDGSQSYGTGSYGGASGASWGQSAVFNQDKWAANSN